MSDENLPRAATEAASWLEDRLTKNESVLAAVEGQREGPRRVWLVSTLVLFILVGGLLPGLFLKVLGIIPAAIIATRIAGWAGRRFVGNELPGFGMTVAVTPKSYFVLAHRGLAGGGDVHGPYARAGVDAKLKRRLLSNSLVLSGAVDLRVRVAPGAALNGFLDEVRPPES